MAEPDALLRVGQRRAVLAPARDVKAALAVLIARAQAREHSRLIAGRQPIEPLAQRGTGSSRELASLGHGTQLI